MWRALVFVGLLCLAAFAAVWLANHPGTVVVTWNGREYLTSLAVALVGALVLAMLLAAVWGLIGALTRLPTRIGEGSRAKRRTRGHLALSRGLVAIGSGDVATARRYAGEAERLVRGDPLTLLLRAQTAQAAGDRPGAEAAFRRMLDHSETRVLGLRGLFVEARRRGDVEAARHSAEEAARIAPAAAWANEAVLDGHSADGDWGAALRAVERRGSLGLADKSETRRQRAVLHTADALAKNEAGQIDGALAAAQQALALVPDLVPAAALAARILSQRGDLRRAAKLVEAAWTTNQHPDLAAAYLNLRPGDSAMDRLGRAESLARLSSWSAESRLAIGRAAIEAREFSRARETLRPLVEERPTVRVCLMMAELEQAEGQSGRVREWLARAARAPRDKAWIADGIVSDVWAPVSPVTGRLDAFVWETPPDMLGRPDRGEADFLDGAMTSTDSEPPAAVPPGGGIPAESVLAETGGRKVLISPASDAVAVPKTLDPSPALPGQTSTLPSPNSTVPGQTSTVSSPSPGIPSPDGPVPVPEPAKASTGLGATPLASPVPTPVAEPAPAPAASVPAQRPREPAPVVFPFAQPPDDPGPKAVQKRSSSRS